MIIEYESKYIEEVKDLLCELQEHIVNIDKEKYNVLTNEFRDSYFNKLKEEEKKKMVKCSYTLKIINVLD